MRDFPAVILLKKATAGTVPARMEIMHK